MITIPITAATVALVQAQNTTLGIHHIETQLVSKIID